MKRREFIKAGAATATVAGAAGVGGAVGSACGGLFEGDTLDVGRIPLPQMDDYLRKVDDGMQRIAEWDRREDIPETELDHALENELGKKALRALYITGMFGDLPDAGQVHPGMQERVKRSLPEMDEAVAEMAELLSNVSDEDAEALQGYLREKDNPGMEIAQWFDEVESALGVSARRRRQTRAFITQAVSRLKNQSPRLLFDEYVGKVERVAAQSGSAEEVERRLIARMGQEAFFERQQRLAMYAAAWAEAGVTAEDLPPVEISELAETDGGVDADAGATSEPVDAGTLPDLDELKAISSKWEVDHSKKSCAEIDRELKDLILYRERGLYTAGEAEVRYSALKAERSRRDCRVEEAPPGPGDPRARDGLTVAQRKYKLLRAGWVCFGLGILLSGTTVLLIFTGGEAVGIFLTTPAAILLLIGLFMLPIVYAGYSDVESENPSG